VSKTAIAVERSYLVKATDEVVIDEQLRQRHSTRSPSQRLPRIDVIRDVNLGVGKVAAIEKCLRGGTEPAAGLGIKDCPHDVGHTVKLGPQVAFDNTDRVLVESERVWASVGRKLRGCPLRSRLASK
jgi:hypothetical protein